MAATDRFLQARPSYVHCGLCGRVPRGRGESGTRAETRARLEEPNRAPLRWWDADDGWRITTLCRWCWEEVCDDRPKPADFAARLSNGVCDDEDTDEDAAEAL